MKIEELKIELKGEYVKLGDIISLIRGKTLPKDKFRKGKYPVISGGSNISGYHDETNCVGKKYIFVARVGSAGYVSKYENDCFLTDLCFGMICNNNNYLIEYVYYYMKIHQYKIYNLCATNGAPNINWETLKQIQIPIISLDHQQEIVTLLDKIFKEYDINKLSNEIKDVEIFDLLIKENYEKFEYMLYMIYEKMKMTDKLKSFNDDNQFIDKKLFDVLNNVHNDDKGYYEDIKYMIYEKMKMEDQIKRFNINKQIILRNKLIKYKIEEYKLNDLIEFIKGTNDKQFYSSIDEYILLIMNGKKISSECGSVYLVKNKNTFTASNCVLIKKTNIDYNIKYLYYYIKYNRDYIITFIKNEQISDEDLKKIIIKIPTLDNQLDIIKSIEKAESYEKTLIEWYNNIEQEINIMYESIKNLKMNIPVNNQNDELIEDEIKKDIIVEPVIEKIVLPRKKILVKVMKKVAKSNVNVQTIQ